MSNIEYSGPICNRCGVLFVAEGPCTEPGCGGVATWEATADRLAERLREATWAETERDELRTMLGRLLYGADDGSTRTKRHMEAVALLDRLGGQ
jgi:hypothetical protein